MVILESPMLSILCHQSKILDKVLVRGEMSATTMCMLPKFLEVYVLGNTAVIKRRLNKV